MTGMSAQDMVHIKYCRDTRCRTEGNAGKRCLELDHLLGRVPLEATGNATVTSSGVRATINEDRLSEFKVVLDLEDAPEVQNPNLPGSPTVRPQAAVILAYPREGGGWEVSLINAIGPRVYEATGRLTKRDFNVAFVNPMDEDSLTPGWLLEIATRWENRLNGVSLFAPFQVYAHEAFLVCERCDTNVTFKVEDPRLTDLTEAAQAHSCDPARVTAEAADGNPFAQS